MPRRHRAARDRRVEPGRPERAKVRAPAWSEAPGVEVREVTGDKPYRCPGCDHEVRPGTAHLVVIPDHSAEARRHWHTNCWKQELRRQRILR